MNSWTKSLEEPSEENSIIKRKTWYIQTKLEAYGKKFQIPQDSVGESHKAKRIKITSYFNIFIYANKNGRNLGGIGGESNSLPVTLEE